MAEPLRPSGLFGLVAIAVLVFVPEARAQAVDAGRQALAAVTSPASSSARPVRVPASCRTLPAGIKQQESGGRYGVRGVPVASHGGDRALGAYQVMPANLPGWSREVVGRTVTEDEYMASPALQDRIAGTKLGQLCAAYGPRGAAAAWFSGRPELADDPTPRGGGAASVKSYVDNVMALSGRYGK